MEPHHEFIYFSRGAVAQITMVIMTPKLLMLIFDAALVVLLPVLTGKVLLEVSLAPVALTPVLVALGPVALPIPERLELPEAGIGKPPCAHFVVKSDKKNQTTKTSESINITERCILFTLLSTSDCAIVPMETKHSKHVSKPLAIKAVHRHRRTPGPMARHLLF